MRFPLLLGLILMLFSCEETPLPPPIEEEEEVILPDLAPPIIKWVKPCFDEVVRDIVHIQCKALDSSGIYGTVLVVDSLQPGYLGIAVSDSLFEFYWDVSSKENGSVHHLNIFAEDKAGNDTSGQAIRVIVDNTHSYPDPVKLISIDSLMVDSVFTGYSLKWQQAGDNFSRYILQRSTKTVMTGPEEIFSSDILSILEYNDEGSFPENLYYYRIVVEDLFGRKTPGNILSTSMDDMPPEWSVQSVQYTDAWMLVSWNSWDSLTFPDYHSHTLLHGTSRLGGMDTLAVFSDPGKSSFQSTTFEPAEKNWFSVLTADSMGQISISTPYMHPEPQFPVIDSVHYENKSFTLHWSTEPEVDFHHYEVLETWGEDPYHLAPVDTIIIRTDTTLTLENILESEYYLYQIITRDQWQLDSRGPVILTSAFYKFDANYGGANNDVFFASAPFAYGYWAVGESYIGGAVAVKVDSLGNILNSLYHGVNESGFRTVKRRENGTFLLAGYQANGTNREDIWVLNMTEDGLILWENSYGESYNDGANALAELSTGQIGITGFTHLDPGNQDIWVIHVDKDGNENWTRTFGGDQRDVGHDILPADDGGMFILCETHSVGDSEGDTWILKLDAEGNPKDTLIIGGDGLQIGYAFEKSNLGGFTIAGAVSGSNSGITDFAIFSIDSTGENLWMRHFGGGFNDAAYSIVPSEDGWVAAGQTYSFSSGQGDIWVIKVGMQGEYIWDQTFGNNYDDIAHHIGIASDKGFIISGSTYSPQYQKNGWLLKTDTRGNYQGMVEYKP
ncbi:MAG: hypothetical protein QGF36_05665 [Candidatus Marinimicrobia bacterium]|nr:hypothetical protein [Candidatus Neomarinimicrobiota bacterium]